MKFSKSGHALLAAAVSVGIGLGITSCGQSNTVDYLYVTDSKNNPGQISVYRVDQESGALTQIQDSPYSSGGRNPVAEVTSPNGNNLYVINHDDNTIVEFAIGTDAKLYPQHTYQTPGSEPLALAINKAGTLLFVVDTFQPNGSPQQPGPGAVVVFPVNSDGSLGTAVANGNLSYWPVGNYPSAVNVLANGNFLYVVNTNSSISATGINNNTGNPTAPSTNSQGSISAFSVASNGALTELTNLGSPIQSGVAPNAAASDPTSRFLYVTDGATNQLIAYTILSTGAITPLQNGPFKTDVFPNGITIDFTGQYIYVTNFNSNDISAYTIGTDGTPSSLAGGGTFAVDTGPTCVIVEPALGRFVYTASFLGNSVTGYRLNPNTGLLTGTENSPYPTAGQSTCVAAVPHGNHASQHVQATSGNGAS
jgi:6-phosphogluconolactonase